jgi:hypothetical protein
MRSDLSLLLYRKKELKSLRSVDMTSLAVAKATPLRSKVAPTVTGGPHCDKCGILANTEKRHRPGPKGRNCTAFNDGCCNEHSAAVRKHRGKVDITRS